MKRLIILFLLLIGVAHAQRINQGGIIETKTTCLTNEYSIWYDNSLDKFRKCFNGVIGDAAVSAGGSIPAGSILVIITGTCPTGFTEVSALSGKSLRGTVAANADIGDSVGSDTATPTVNSLSAAAQTFTGSSTTVPALAVGTLANTWPVGVPTVAMNSYTPAGTIACGTAVKVGTSASNACPATAPTFTGTPATLTGTISWPGAVPTIAGSTATGILTPLGTNSTSAVTGTLNAVNTIPASVKVIFCSKD